ncbi:hypothetical protein B5V88_08075 [Heyndrickxia sporothermodurans]|uniref:Cytochrome c oxidase assembly protein n=1 Tax=Heyndrickxia sporothermodurans TaxID=46224 RepID=A0AB37HE76_9BACI|nr:cytochrome c oxidase assembly protein [Heyndrickxia sporothermodurans]MBL5768340.1 cytochrome c oxidase assembly protein [Heyndrickxia sporothermodurans]MBL5771985.1 cytochrome c oxidase assembly protein [Heyndrickxia sporothermodurans]MBL5775593.1 cytochrome c oxidase assembly protein [Heyndrickxia sporothermodurans]MBL5779130.1 cytochrome c oxidase assembly protein [Heyndrickxia sporothermodurans]MBL5783298.1 cytochrome c oxidase assembly protein [Heyndrickxia sporothermodurans]
MHNINYHGDEFVPEVLLALPFIVVFILYIFAVVVSNRRHKKWSLYRTTSWIFGVICVLIAVIGPLADRSHVDFSAHMLGHLLLGMLAPLFMVLAAPMTLILRTLNVRTARKLSRLLRSRLVSVFNNPIITSVLNIGGLWLLYTTNLYNLMHENIFVHVFVHLHVFIAGYLFTASLIYIDPTPHRVRFVYRAIVFILALAGHGILSKYIYAHPPNGVPQNQAEAGGMLMYYGGDVIDAIIIFIFCFHWYRAIRPKASFSRITGI